MLPCAFVCSGQELHAPPDAKVTFHVLKEGSEVAGIEVEATDSVLLGKGMCVYGELVMTKCQTTCIYCELSGL